MASYASRYGSGSRTSRWTCGTSRLPSVSGAKHGGERGGVGEGLVEDACHVGQELARPARRQHDLVVLGAEPSSDVGSRGPLVIGRLDEADGERLHGAPRLGNGQGGDEARV